MLRVDPSVPCVQNLLNILDRKYFWLLEPVINNPELFKSLHFSKNQQKNAYKCLHLAFFNESVVIDFMVKVWILILSPDFSNNWSGSSLDFVFCSLESYLEALHFHLCILDLLWDLCYNISYEAKLLF